MSSILDFIGGLFGFDDRGGGPTYDQDKARKKAEKAARDREEEILRKKRVGKAGLLSLGGGGDTTTPNLGTKTLGSK